MSEENQKEICLYCKWWDQKNPDWGECRVLPPAMGEHNIAAWPETAQSWWCGSFTDRPDDHTSDTPFEHLGDAAVRVIGRIKPGDAA
jgi:hypothetical protein